MIRVLSLVMLGALITSCGNNKEALIGKACAQLKAAWDNQGLDRRFEHYAAASDAFRELSAIDSGFAKYASRANEAANDAVTNYTEFYEMINFCGLK